MNQGKPSNPPPYAPLAEQPQTAPYPPNMQYAPPPGQPQYGPPPQQYGVPPQQYGVPPQQYGVPPQQPVMVRQTHVQVVRGGCPHCGGVLQDEYSACGIVMAVLFFPLGLLCCLMMQEKRCVNCGATF